MKERPILFTGPMVRAIMDGRKTQTRRVANKKLGPVFQESLKVNGRVALHMVGYDIPLRYGDVGDRLWVKETSANVGTKRFPEIRYAAEEDICTIRGEYFLKFKRELKFKPSIFMRRKESRITLEIVGIRVERLNDITENGAMAEGTVIRYPDDKYSPASQKHRIEFEILWNSINSKRGLGWSVNPWVWVIEFKRVTA